ETHCILIERFEISIMANAMQRKCKLSPRQTGFLKSVRFFTGFLAATGTAFVLVPSVQAQPTSQPASAQRHSSLPRAALEKAREAEKQLAANAPEKAIAILRDL